MSNQMFMTGTYPLAKGVQAACERAAKAAGCDFVGPLTGPSDSGRWWFVAPCHDANTARAYEREIKDQLRAAGALDEQDRPRRAQPRKFAR